MNTKSGIDVGGLGRRDFLRVSATALGALGMGGVGVRAATAQAAADVEGVDTRAPNSAYAGPFLERVAFPMGGIGAGMLCLDGVGAISHVSLQHRPDVFNEPCAFAAISFPGKNLARVVEGPVPGWKVFGGQEDALGAPGTTYGLPRFSQASFTGRFPFGIVQLKDPQIPVSVEITGWSPFTPGDADASSLPVAALEYCFSNASNEPCEAVFSYNLTNFMAKHAPSSVVRPLPGGFVLRGTTEANQSWDEGFFAAAVSDPAVKANHAWFRGEWWDPLMMAWKDVASGAVVERAPVDGAPATIGASLFVPFRLAPGESKTIALRLCWYVPKTRLFVGDDPWADTSKQTLPEDIYTPWYAARFSSIDEVAKYWAENYDALRQRSAQFRDCFFDSSLPTELVEAVGANLSILKSPTMLRQADGKMWAWEGCGDNSGSCPGSCTHVWNYAQAVAHLFPELERSLRETEFGPAQDERGHQNFRVPLPIRTAAHTFHAAADGQLGGLMKLHREWRISGDREWLRRLWPSARRSLDFCIATWDPEHKGWVREPHHNTYDIEFWGPDGMCTSIYLGALLAAVKMGRALGDDVTAYEKLYQAGTRLAEAELFNGEYFFQKIEWKNLKAGDPTKGENAFAKYSPEARALLEKEGPKYQYGAGCLSDGVLGAWFAKVCGVGEVLDQKKIESHLVAVHRHNLKRDLSAHANPQRPSYAVGREGGLLLCTWPKGGALSLPFVYSNEVWTGIEYQVASHLLLLGHLDEGCEIVKFCRARYDGRVRNPFDEYECGHWYARALASYGLLQGWSGARYDAVEKVLYVTPAHRRDFRCFLSTATGYGTVVVKDGTASFNLRSGHVDIGKIVYSPLA